jgi:glutathione S-transferase
MEDPMALTLLLHPLASYCHKVLIALYERDVPFVPQHVDLGDPASAAELLAAWPLGKIPVLCDGDRIVPETSVIVEYLDRRHPGAAPLVPTDPESALEARLWDRFFDLYVSTPMQKIVGDRLRPEAERDQRGVAEARATLRAAYDQLEARLATRTWAIGDAFSLADCAAAPALFYAECVEPFCGTHPSTARYFERLTGRPSVRRTLAEARPWFPLFPYREAIPPRFLGDA